MSSSQKKQKPKSRLRRLSDSKTTLFRRRIVRRDSGYSSDDQKPKCSAAAEDDVAATDSLSNSSGLSIDRLLNTLESQEEVEEVDEAYDEEEDDEDEDDEDEDEDYEDEAEELEESPRMSNSERHLISIRFSLQQEHEKTWDTLLLADVREIEEIEQRKRMQAKVQRRKRQEEESVGNFDLFNSRETDLFSRSQRKPAASAGSILFNFACSSMMQQSRQAAYDRDLRRNCY